MLSKLQESTAYLIPWLVAEFLRQIFFLAAFIYLAWLISVLVMKQYTECKSQIINLKTVRLVAKSYIFLSLF